MTLHFTKKKPLPPHFRRPLCVWEYVKVFMDAVIQRYPATEARLNVIKGLSVLNLSRPRLAWKPFRVWRPAPRGPKNSDFTLHEARDHPQYTQRTPKYCQIQRLVLSVWIIRTIFTHQSARGKLQHMLTVWAELRERLCWPLQCQKDTGNKWAQTCFSGRITHIFLLRIIFHATLKWHVSMLPHNSRDCYVW